MRTGSGSSQSGGYRLQRAASYFDRVELQGRRTAGLGEKSSGGAVGDPRREGCTGERMEDSEATRASVFG